MAYSGNKPCSQCGKATRKRFCEQCKEDGTISHNLYNTRAWRRARTAHLDQYPLCVMCMNEGISRLATITDHVIPHRGREDIFWDQDNWQSLCIPCHNSKTQKE